MLYYISRILIFITLIAISSVLLIKKNIISFQPKDMINLDNKCSQKLKFTLKSKKIWSINILVILLITLISFYPIEGNFLRFNSPEESINYSVIDNFLWENYIIEDDDACFVYSQKNSNIAFHTISKYENGYGMLNYKSKERHYGNSRNTLSDRSYSIYCYAIYNTDSNSTCYFLKYALPFGNKEDNIVKFNNKNTDCIYYVEKGKSMYTIIEEGTFKEHFTVSVNGVDVQF